MVKPKRELGRIRELNERTCHSVDVYTGAEKMTAEKLRTRETPRNVKEAQKEARRWWETNWFVEQTQLLKSAFFNYGLRITAKDTAKAEALKKYLDGDEGGNRIQLTDFIEAVWNEWILQDNVVGMWRSGDFPWIIKAEQCDYSNAFGNNLLKVCPEIGKEQLQGMTKDEVGRFGQSEIKINSDSLEKFRVLTRQLPFYGFGMPRLRRVFTELSQADSMRVGENMYAYAGRMVVRLHKMGFEVRSTAGALKQSEYLWKKKRSDGILAQFRGVAGFKDITTQFDHNVSYLWIDPKQFDSRKWATVVDRLMWWAGPAGFLLMAKQLPPQLFQFFGVEAAASRKKVGPYLEYILNSADILPKKIKLKLSWGNRCFTDPRLGWDMAKTLLKEGPLSPQSALEAGDFDVEEEMQRKEEAAKKPERHMPLWDSSHGNRPENAGRKSGTKNGDVV